MKQQSEMRHVGAHWATPLDDGDLMELWQRQLIRYLFHYSAKRLRIESAFAVKQPHVPKRLYKYRRFCPQHLDALERNYLWMSAASGLNDPYDSAARFEQDRFLVEDRPLDEALSKIKKADDPAKADPAKVLGRRLKNPVPSGEWIRRISAELLDQEKFDRKEEFLQVLEEFSQQQSKEMVKRWSEAARAGVGVVSLSEDPLSILMWAHYADSNTGFCVEYDFDSLPTDDIRIRICYPVLYTKKLRDATRYFAKVDGSDRNNLFGNYMCLLKKDDWRYEQEWRIVDNVGPGHASREIPMPQPSAIILGLKTSEEHAEIIRKLCRARSIVMRRIVQDPMSFNLETADVALD